jgi:cytochrome c oxidase assembly protein subunit 15
MQTPLGWAASRWELGPRALRWSSTAALIVSIIIVFTGGLVRVTGSGLGCPTWPTCEGTSIAPSAELGIHGIIEFSNRMLTTVIVLAVAWVIIAARLQRPRIRYLTRLAWSQFWLIVANAVAGGITVLVQLNPWVVALHFVLAIALLATTTLTWHRVHEETTLDVTPTDAATRALAWTLVLATLVLILVGTLVAGTGPHSGDSADVPRMQLDWTVVTVIHGILGVLVLGVAAVMLGRPATTVRARLVRRRVVIFVLVVALQGVIGVVQAVGGLPALLVALHFLGAALVWVGALRVLLDAEPRLFAGATTHRENTQALPERLQGSSL